LGFFITSKVGLVPIFYLMWDIMKRHTALETVIGPTVVGMGFEFVGLEYLAYGKHSTLRIYIDKPEGISIDDCEKVSRQVGSVLDVESSLVRGDYTLEVSSPGVDRKIFTLEQLLCLVGTKVRVSLQTPVAGQRNFVGTLSSVIEGQVCLEVNGSAINVDFANIAQANVIDEKTRL
jgi:ribosome maturation factor RimP